MLKTREYENNFRSSEINIDLQELTLKDHIPLNYLHTYMKEAQKT
jgi:hypothetical protein